MPSGWNGRQAWLRTTCPKGRGGSNPPEGMKKMENNYDKIEEDLKEKDEPKKEVKKSGRSVFKLQEIIKKKAKQNTDDNQQNNRPGI